jgi:small GTP-binding protein
MSKKQAKFTFKVLLLGDAAVGKTSLVRRFVHDTFSKDYLMTIGMEPYQRYETIDGVYICYSLWDIAGQDRFKMMRSMFYKGAMGALVIFDLTRRASFENAQHWITEAESFSPGQSFILVGNKNDLSDMREISPKEGQAKAKEIGAIGYIETSAKTGEKVASTFDQIGSTLLAKRKK